ncbi:MAG: TatD family hydrolase [Ktedonobacterales bacterium]|nr:TatD family hydrolase [Ktedonobacterales bacterium]
MSQADSHVHLDRYDDAEVAALLARATAAGVRALLTVGVDVPSSKRAVALARRFGPTAGVVAAVGLHPAFLPTRGWEAALAKIARLAATAPHQVRALGEIGADTLEGTAPLALQMAVFHAQLALARRLGLPTVLHVRGEAATDAVRATLVSEGIGAGAVVHYFVGDIGEARAWLALGCAIAVGRPATRVGETALRAALASPDLPLARLLIETDTYPLPGRTTEPAQVVAVADAIAALKGVPPAEVARATTARFTALFGAPP